eukprot:CAMPEP_0181179770 /NCGR_PEP_ID=MMETSP1096-20121128/6440_1 /TAXON_ID=156174 ORGANISM="Chrysochromulina ericina, Strain CCMP281" /NCGR_SAMPLE_ID=MMETSP1096 /ASSEMBLY_ACC=CAM_ASM_000453 /LENGTH=132 /DNA_ID=CAMNT_0023268147 /DNA_START=470 /DNA_END=869 /DNA_ORIENTATION=-
MRLAIPLAPASLATKSARGIGSTPLLVPTAGGRAVLRSSPELGQSSLLLRNLLRCERRDLTARAWRQARGVRIAREVSMSSVRTSAFLSASHARIAACLSITALMLDATRSNTSGNSSQLRTETTNGAVASR